MLIPQQADSPPEPYVPSSAPDLYLHLRRQGFPHPEARRRVSHAYCNDNLDAAEQLVKGARQRFEFTTNESEAAA